MESERLTRGQAIREKCIDCMCGQSGEVRRCPSRDCALWSFRMGRETHLDENGVERYGGGQEVLGKGDRV